MKASILVTSALLSTAVALPGAPAMITAAPEPHGASQSTKATCTSTQCYDSYVECYGSLTLINTYCSLRPGAVVYLA
ncbi:hypothetical protein F4861DRAFT_522543 [Xylaria intraflava]|nr:hypothetical protein F4861DRAFT_522543 [Xylaria intraflava]